jgi:hypothetical protein
VPVESAQSGFQKKKVKNQKSMRGQPETEYGEVKKPVSFSLTKTGQERLKEIGKQLNISVSEFLERVARGIYQIDFSDQSQETE